MATYFFPVIFNIVWPLGRVKIEFKNATPYTRKTPRRPPTKNLQSDAYTHKADPRADPQSKEFNRIAYLALITVMLKTNKNQWKTFKINKIQAKIREVIGNVIKTCKEINEKTIQHQCACFTSSICFLQNSNPGSASKCTEFNDFRIFQLCESWNMIGSMHIFQSFFSKFEPRERFKMYGI